MLIPQYPNCRGGVKSSPFDRANGWLMLSILAMGVSGCGVGTSSSTPTDASASGNTTNTGGEAAPNGGGNPGILVTPAGGGGIVVGDPLDAGRAPPAATPELSRREREEADGAAAAFPPGAAARAASAAHPGVAQAPHPEDDPNSTPQPPITALQRLEQADEASPAGVPQNGQPLPPFRAAALAEDKGEFADSPRRLTKREEAQLEAGQLPANAGRFPPGTVGREDVDAPPAAVGQNAPVPGPEGRFLRGEDGDEQFVPGGAGGQANANIEIKRGSAEEVTTTFLTLVAAGEIEKAKPLIAGRATGILAKLRDDTATPEEIEELKGLAAVRQQENNRPKGGTHRLITFRADKKMLAVEAEQKDEDSCVFRLDIRDAPRRRK